MIVDESFAETMKRVVALYVSKIADDEIDKECAKFREKMLAQKGQIVGRIINAIDITINSSDGGKCDITIVIKR